MSARYRRRLLVALAEQNPRDDRFLDPLSAVSTRGPSDDALHTEIVHRHLPKLDEMGFVEWDRDTGQIRKGPHWDEVAPLVRLIRDHRDELPDGWL